MFAADVKKSDAEIKPLNLEIADLEQKNAELVQTRAELMREPAEIKRHLEQKGREESVEPTARETEITRRTDSENADVNTKEKENGFSLSTAEVKSAFDVQDDERAEGCTAAGQPHGDERPLNEPGWLLALSDEADG